MVRLSESERAQSDLDDLLELSDELVRTGDLSGSLHRIASRLSTALGSDRCSVLLLDSERAVVIADSEDPKFRPLELALADYPEIRETARREEPLIVDDVERNVLFDEVRTQIKDKPVGSAILFPVLTNDEVLAVLHLRTSERRLEPLQAGELRFGRIVANATGIALRNERMVEKIRDRSERVRNERDRVKKRLRQIEKFERFFDLAGDGMMIVDGAGEILFANRAAQRLTGLDEAAICTLTLHDLVSDEGRSALRELMAEIVAGTSQQTREVAVVKASGDIALFSFTAASLDPASRVPNPDSATARRPRDVNGIVTFRDVTETRTIEEELRRTNHFLMNIMSSSADAIVVADMEGRILIFNEVAAQITGYTEEEAKKIPVRFLYPEGTARRLMRDLRTPNNGGVGKLEERREDLLTKDGARVPVNLAAAIVYDEGEEIATVGIFSDLRERLRLEAEVQQAERATTAVETAGAAAHELNQPLTSIIGSVELLARKVPEASAASPYLETILSESERMASIVAKLAQITQYRTRPYVGRTDILDLDAASLPDEETHR